MHASQDLPVRSAFTLSQRTLNESRLKVVVTRLASREAWEASRRRSRRYCCRCSSVEFQESSRSRSCSVSQLNRFLTKDSKVLLDRSPGGRRHASFAQRSEHSDLVVAPKVTKRCGLRVENNLWIRLSRRRKTSTRRPSTNRTAGVCLHNTCLTSARQALESSMISDNFPITWTKAQATP